jgi:hypothetical protein
LRRRVVRTIAIVFFSREMTSQMMANMPARHGLEYSDDTALLYAKLPGSSGTEDLEDGRLRSWRKFYNGEARTSCTIHIVDADRDSGESVHATYFILNNRVVDYTNSAQNVRSSL